MKQYGFDSKTISGYNCYGITADQLKTVATKRKWLHDLAKDFADEDDEPIEVGADDNDKWIDGTAEYHKLEAKYGALLKLQKKTSDSDSDNDSDSEDEPTAKKRNLSTLVKKVSEKKSRQHLSKSDHALWIDD